MNINIFEKAQSELKTETSFVDEQALSIKQKIESRKNKQKKIKTIFWVLIFLIVIFATTTAYSQYKLFKLTKEESPNLSLPTASSTDKTVVAMPKTGEEVIAALKRHILVPSGEPQIAEVQDAAKLRETQAFFKDTRTGDIVIVYDTTIFIYRPSDDIVVASGDISGVGQVKP